jgi:MFS family permease
MFASFGLPITEVSVYTGIGESSMVAIEGLIAIPFARLADRVGRKPVLLGSVLSISIAAIGMGTSGSAWQVILWRVLGTSLSSTHGSDLASWLQWYGRHSYHGDGDHHPSKPHQSFGVVRSDLLGMIISAAARFHR